MYVSKKSWELRTIQTDPAWEMIAGVYLRQGSPTHSVTCSYRVDDTFQGLKRWDWTPGRLTAPMLDELGGVLGDGVVQALMRVEGITQTLWGPV